MNNETVIKILLIEDDWMHRRSLKELQTIDPRFQIIAEAENDQQALSYLATQSFDLVIMDYELKGSKLWGAELTEFIRNHYPQVKVIFCSANIRAVDVETALKAGACSYIPKENSIQEIRQAIYIALSGEKYLPNLPECGLTERQKEVLQLFGEGTSTRNIVFKLWDIKTFDDFGSHLKTVYKHIENIKECLKIKSREKLMMPAILCHGRLENRRIICENNPPPDEGNSNNQCGKW